MGQPKKVQTLNIEEYRKTAGFSGKTNGFHHQNDGLQ